VFNQLKQTIEYKANNFFSNWVPLHWAILFRNTPVIEYLLEKNASLEISDCGISIIKLAELMAKLDTKYGETLNIIRKKQATNEQTSSNHNENDNDDGKDNERRGTDEQSLVSNQLTHFKPNKDKNKVKQKKLNTQVAPTENKPAGNQRLKNN
jgi:ankyrin repeat protein